MKYSVITFGCRVNQADSLGFEEDLRARGAVAAPPEAADLVIVNTCSVTATADQGARQTIRRIARDNPAAQIVVTGCYATRRPDEIAALPNVARVVANDEKPRLAALIWSDRDRPNAVSGSVRLQPDLIRPQPDLTTATRFNDGDGPCGAAIEPGVAGRTAYTLRVQTGCAEPCSYCIIPSTRGSPRSVSPGRVIAEIARIATAGFKEIALTGVHLGSYGRDLTPRSSLIELLRAIDRWSHEVRLKPDTTETPSDRWRGTNEPVVSGFSRTDGVAAFEPAPVLFRISSLEPMDCTRQIVDFVAESDAFAPHFHLPLQHASNRMLSAMRRPYSVEQYAGLAGDIRARIPDASIGSDVIVGFPGETDADFEHLASYLETSPLTHIHVFPYSDRPGTEASAMTGKVHGSVIRERARQVREMARRLTDRFHESQVGTRHTALTIEDGTLVVTGNYLKVRIPPGRRRNEWVRVAINGINPLLGTVV
jgi:threonylcarbamoyladenosine tRNA methylthiotransferase MtaB